MDTRNRQQDKGYQCSVATRTYVARCHDGLTRCGMGSSSTRVSVIHRSLLCVDLSLTGASIRTHAHTCTHARTHTHTWCAAVCVLVFNGCLDTHAHTHKTHTHTHTYTNTHSHTHPHTHMHTHSHTWCAAVCVLVFNGSLDTRAHTHTHTHTVWN